MKESRIVAASEKGSTQWLRTFLRSYLLRLTRGEITGAEFAEELESEFASRRLTSVKQQKNYRSNVVQALKMVDVEPAVIALVSPTTEDYRRLNDEQRGRVAERSTQYLEPEAVETLVSRAERLIESAEWSEVGAGLAVLIGRRISEILLSEYTLQSTWSLNFSQMVKKGEEVDITIEIPTLARAEKVLSAIEKLQQRLTVSDLRRNNASSIALKQAVNHRYSLAVAQQCEAHFSGLVPNRSDKENLYTHIFRAVYATIAAHWYCPPSVPEHQYKAEIQGHFTLTEAGKKLPNYAARSNYDDYAIGDGKGNRDGRLGIKLGQVPGLEIIAAFREDAETAPQDNTAENAPPTSTAATLIKKAEIEPPMPKPPERSLQRLMVYAEDLSRLQDLTTTEGRIDSVAEQLRALLDAYEAAQSQPQPHQTATLGELAQTFHWFTQQIDALAARNRELEQQRENPTETAHLTELETENAQLKRELDEVQHQLESVCTEKLTELETENAQLKRELGEAQHQLESVCTEKLTELETENAQLKRELGEAQHQLEAIYKVLGQPVPSQNEAASAAASPASPPVPPVVPTAAASPSAPRQRDRLDSKSKVEAIIQDIINWNTAQPSNDTRLRISISVIKALGSLVGATYQPVIMEVLKEQESVIEEIHQRFMLGARHNVSVDKDAVLQGIARDYMGVENWQEAAY